MAQRLLSKIELARLAGVSGQAISKALRGALRAALVGDRVDVDHAATVAYLKGRGKKPPPAARPPTKPAKRAPRSPRTPTTPVETAFADAGAPTASRPDPPAKPPKLDPQRGLEQLAELVGFADMTMRDLAERYGTFRGFTDLLDALKTIAETQRIELANNEKRGSLISRDLVRTHVIGALDSVQKRLLSDAPRTIASRVFGMARSNASVEEAEKTVRELIGSQLKPVKATAVRVLRAAAVPQDDQPRVSE